MLPAPITPTVLISIFTPRFQPEKFINCNGSRAQTKAPDRFRGFAMLF
jgi:hypothetical protein